MKSLIGALPMAIAVGVSAAQFGEDLPRTLSVIAQTDGLEWTRAMDSSPPLPNASAVDQRITTYLGTSREEDKVHRSLLRAHEPSARAAVATLRDALVSVPDYMPPVQVVVREKDLILVLPPIASTAVFNTLRLSARERASEAFRQRLLPAIRALAGIEHTTATHFGVATIYGAKDFSDKMPELIATRPEMLATVYPVALGKQLESATLAEEEFVDKAEIYLADRESFGKVSKIKLTLR